MTFFGSTLHDLATLEKHLRRFPYSKSQNSHYPYMTFTGPGPAGTATATASCPTCAACTGSSVTIGYFTHETQLFTIIKLSSALYFTCHAAFTALVARRSRLCRNYTFPSSRSIVAAGSTTLLSAACLPASHSTVTVSRPLLPRKMGPFPPADCRHLTRYSTTLSSVQNSPVFQPTTL